MTDPIERRADATVNGFDPETDPLAPSRAAIRQRDQLLALINENGGRAEDFCAVDAIRRAFALIPKGEPTDGMEVDVPDWVVGQIEQEIRAEMQEAIEAATALAFDAGAREVANYMRGWNEALAAVDAHGRAGVEPMTPESLAPVEGLGEPEEEGGADG